MTEAYGITIFCDDIRQEVFGKISLMGIYGSDLKIFSSLPSILPKLCMLVNARFGIGQTITNPKLQIYLPEDSDTPSIIMDLPWTIEKTDELNPPPFPDALQTMNLTNYTTIAPFVIKQEGYLRVRSPYG